MKRNIEKEFVVMSPEKEAKVEAFDSTMYERLVSDYQGFKGHELISCHVFDQDWSSWEMHPHGDEVVLLISGKTTLVLALDEGNKEVQLEHIGDYVIVPKNTWHTAKTQEECKLFFVTPGEGTQNRDI